MANLLGKSFFLIINGIENYNCNLLLIQIFNLCQLWLKMVFCSIKKSGFETYSNQSNLLQKKNLKKSCGEHVPKLDSSNRLMSNAEMSKI